jgi:hypothetical protein
MKKKLAAIAIAAAMSLSVVVCGGSSSSSSQPASSSTKTETSNSEASSSSSAASSTSATSTSSSTDAASAFATLDAYNQVKEGMTLDEVNQIFGFDGTKAASGSASAAGMSSTAEVYTWTGETAGATASIGFQDGKVVSMAQAGLK